jgi:hypothetical protein
MEFCNLPLLFCKLTTAQPCIITWSLEQRERHASPGRVPVALDALRLGHTLAQLLQ